MAANSMIQNAMARLGLGEAQPTATGSGHSTQTETRDPSKAVELGRFEQRLNHILVRQGPNLNDKIFVVDLTKCHAKLGDKWEKVQDKVHAKVRSIFDRRLGDSDLYIQRDDNSYLVVFGNISTRQAQLRCVALGEEILTHLAGRESVTDIVGVKTVEVEENGQMRLHDLPPIQSILVQASKEFSAHAPAPDRIKGVVVDKTDAPGFEDVAFVYRPMLSVRTKIISTFICLPIRKLHGNAHISGYDMLEQGTFAQHYLELDRLTVKNAAKDMGGLRESGAKSLLAVPVHYETVADSRRRTEFINLCADEFKGMTDRVVYEMVGLPDGIPQVRLTELVSLLRPHGRAIIARFPPDHRNFAAFRVSGLHAVGVDLYNVHQREDSLMRDLDEFAQAANANSLKTYALGVRSISLYTAIVAAGFDYAAGHALTSAAGSPENAYVYRMESPYLAVLDSAGSENEGAPKFEDQDDPLRGEAE